MESKSRLKTWVSWIGQRVHDISQLTGAKHTTLLLRSFTRFTALYVFFPCPFHSYPYICCLPSFQLTCLLLICFLEPHPSVHLAWLVSRESGYSSSSPRPARLWHWGPYACGPLYWSTSYLTYVPWRYNTIPCENGSGLAGWSRGGL